MARQPTKKVQDMADELISWLPNYDFGEGSYPEFVWRLLASMPGGDEAEDMGYEPFNLSWQELTQVQDLISSVEDADDVSDLIQLLMKADEEDE